MSLNFSVDASAFGDFSQDFVPFQDETSYVLAHQYSLQDPGPWIDLDPEPPLGSPEDEGKARQHGGPGSRQIKHRRTRSGCYTCRFRRVKASTILWNLFKQLLTREV